MGCYRRTAPTRTALNTETLCRRQVVDAVQTWYQHALWVARIQVVLSGDGKARR